MPRAYVVSFASLLAIAAVGCSVLVDPDDQAPRCDPTITPDPCPVGFVCRGNRCVDEGGRLDGGPMDVPRVDGCTPDPRGELCDQNDNDCDGEVDEGHDADGDTFKWCGDGVSMASADCDDTNPAVRPGAQEICDSRDNNCNGMIDEGASDSCATAGDQCVNGACLNPEDCRNPGRACSAPTPICDTTQTPFARCVADACDEVACAGMGGVCDPVRGTCVIPVALGEACTSDAECVTNVCADREAVGLTDGPLRFCSEACCTDADCDDGYLCWASGTGAKLCVAEGRLGRTRGDLDWTSLCSSGTECESGICFRDYGCLTNCGRDGDCPSGYCTGQGYVRGATTVAQLQCDVALGTNGFNQFCGLGGCASAMCLGEICTRACRTTADCDGRNPACGYALLEGSLLQVCRPGIGAGSGASCTRNGDCLEGACVDLGGAGMRCAPTCCSDADCGGASCKPLKIGMRWEMHCIP